jgi:ADP-heptose:LPS heptosyltransferase
VSRVLAVRLDSDGDVLLTGPAVRALAQRYDAVDLLASPSGSAAAHLLPGVAEVLVAAVPWTGYRPPPADPAALLALADRLRERRYDAALVFTSDHQSPLPAALLLRLAGVPFVAATSHDYPGSLLDLRHPRAAGRHEVEAALDLAAAAGCALPPGDGGRLAVRRPLPDVTDLLPDGPFVVVHPGASVPARAVPPLLARDVARLLAARGWEVLVTGGPDERPLTASVAGGRPGVTDLGGATDLPRLAGLLARAGCLVVGNTGPAHLAAAVGTPVVSLFAPVVPATRWAPYGVPAAVLGDQDAACRGTRARDCPVPGHPCLTGVDAAAVADAVDRLAGPVPAAARRQAVTA